MMTDSSILYKKFGKKVKIERIKQEISQEKLAELADLHRTTIGQIENGKARPSLEVVAKIAEGLNLTLSEIVDLNF